MKKLIFLSLIMAVLSAVSVVAPAHAQDTAKEEKPTFYRLTPGTYVNGWPRFTISYPKDWVEEKPAVQEIFRASDPDQIHGEKFVVAIGPSPQPLDKLADRQVTNFKALASDVTLLSDKRTQLRDGTPAQEVEIQAILSGLPLNYCALATKKGDLWITTGVGSRRGRIREDLKAILYSSDFQQGKDEPVKVSTDIQEFIDRWRNDIVSHDVAKVMNHYSDRFLDSGNKKGAIERFWKRYIGFTTSYEVGITELVLAGDKVYLTGFSIVNGTKWPLGGTSIIKENGEWKWYGNQRDPAP